MRRVQKKTRVDAKNDDEGARALETVEASGDAFIIAGALQYIGDGLMAVAKAIAGEEMAEAGEGEETYMDGTPVR